jgi:protein-tyrosine-phosphatase
VGRQPGIVGSMAEDEVGRSPLIMFVCTGNRARSPLAQALLKRHVAARPLDARSSGVLDLGPLPVLPEMQVIAGTYGVDLSAHRARAFAVGELREADLVLGFESEHVAAAVVDGGARRERTFTLLEFVELMNEFGDYLGVPDPVHSWVASAHGARTGSPLGAPGIADPLGRSSETFERVAEQINESVARLAATLTRALS